MDPAKTIPATVRYEIRIINGPYKFSIKGREFTLEGPHQDIVVLMRMVHSGRLIVDEKIVGVIGDEWNTGSVEFLRLRSFLNDGGVIGLHRDLVC